MPATRPTGQSVIGILPAAGHATRIAPQPCSKELLPLWRAAGGAQPRAVCEHTLARMASAGITRAFVVLRRGKWDIPAHLGERAPGGPSIAYVVASLSYGVPFTLDAAYPFVKGHRVALGFPDILFDTPDAYGRLLEAQDRMGADAVLGLFPADRPQAMDVVETEAGLVRRILIKPLHTTLTSTWGMAVWNPPFTEFMHQHLAQLLQRGRIRQELHVGEVLQAAIDAGLRVAALRVSETPYLDIGSPDGLRRARARLADSPPPA